MRRAIKIVGWSFLVVLAICLVICTACEVRQRILVKRSEALLADIHALRLHHSDWKEAQRLMTRWGRWGHHDGTCTSQDCFYVITLASPMAQPQNTATWASRAVYSLSPVRLLPRQWSGGLFLMHAMFLVEDGVIVRSGTSVVLLISPFAKGVTWSGSSSTIMSVRSQASLGTPEPWEERQRSRHPDYTVWEPGGCSFCVMRRFTYADSMPSEEAARLSDYQLSCATRWSSCLTLEELNPAIDDPLRPETPSPNTGARSIPAACTIPLYAMGRDADRIVPVEVLEDSTNLGKDGDGIEHERSRVRVLAPLKGTAPWANGSIQNILSTAYSLGPGERRPVHLVKARHYFLLPFKWDHGVHEDLSFENCRIIEVDAASEREVRRGMAMDDPLKASEPTISLNGFVRHPPEPRTYGP